MSSETRQFTSQLVGDEELKIEGLRKKVGMGKNLKEKEEYFKCKIFAILILKVLKVIFLF